MIRGFSEHFTGEARKPLCSLVDYISKLRKLCQNFDRLWGKKTEVLLHHSRHQIHVSIAARLPKIY